MINIFHFKSWRKVVAILLAIILLCSTISLASLVYSFQSQINRTQMNENESICNEWISNTDTRLNLIHEQIYDVFLTLFDDTEFQKEPNNIDVFTARKIVNILKNKITASNDISALFLYDVNSDYYSYNVSLKSTTAQSPVVKPFLKEICLQENSLISNHNWSIKYIGGNKYFYQCIKMGRFIIGAISDCKLYGFSHIKTNNNASAFFSDSENTILSFGNEELINNVDLSRKNTMIENNYIVSSIKGNRSNIVGTLFVKYKISIDWSTGVLFVGNAIIEIVLIILLTSYFRHRIMKQTSDLIVATQEVSKGNFDYRINTDDIGSEEFNEIYSNFNNMTSQIKDLKIEQYDMKLSEESNKLRMLRGQLRPHVFMNGITTISNLTYDEDSEKLREYIYQFSQFTRYMLNVKNEMVSIKEELKHIENYIEMQKIKFPNSIEYTCELDKDIEETKIPYLLLFSQVENSFKHALSLIQTLHIKIVCEKYEENGFKGIRLIEEDDGEGFSQEAIDKLNANDNTFTKEHIGLTNTRYTLNLLYKRDDLLRILKSSTGGARVELLIPEIGDKNEIINM